jgi:hypothetical protein
MKVATVAGGCSLPEIYSGLQAVNAPTAGLCVDAINDGGGGRKLASPQDGRPRMERFQHEARGEQDIATAEKDKAQTTDKDTTQTQNNKRQSRH